jgi:putative copper resistance protein D
LTDALPYLRAIHFAATLMVAGVVFFSVLIAEPAFRKDTGDARLAAAVRPRLMSIAWIGLALTVISGVAWLIPTAASMSQRAPADVLSDGVLWTVLSDTTFGNDWLARAVLACLLAGAFAPIWAKQRIASGPIKSVLVILAAALVGALAWSGHAAGGIGVEAIVHPAADALHLVAAAAWVGALVPLTLLLGAVSPETASLTIARTATLRFSALGLVSVGTLLATGIVNTYYLVGGVGALVGTDYGRLLLVKIALFLGMVTVAAFNLLRLTPRIAKLANVAEARAALGQLRRNAVIEVMAGAIVICIVGVLGTMPPAAHAAHQHPAYGALPADAAFQHIHTDQGMADVTILPGRVGTARAIIRLWTDDSEPLAATEVAVTLIAPAPGSKPITRTAAQDADGAWQVDGVELSQSGNWTVAIGAVLAPGKRIVLDAPIVIEPQP